MIVYILIQFAKILLVALVVCFSIISALQLLFGLVIHNIKASMLRECQASNMRLCLMLHFKDRKKETVDIIKAGTNNQNIKAIISIPTTSSIHRRAMAEVATIADMYCVVFQLFVIVVVFYVSYTF